MTPIKIIFRSQESITIYSEDPDEFSKAVLDSKPPEIKRLEYIDDLAEAPELAEVKLTLRSGAIMLCNIPKSEIPKIDFLEEIQDCNTCNLITYGRLAAVEAELDTRFAAVTVVINNIPNLDIRLQLHQAYMKRKQAYVAAIEALVDGVIRRPDENS